jgi:hypothetical protein
LKNPATRMKQLKYIIVKTLLVPHVQVPPYPEKSLRKFQFTAVACSGKKITRVRTKYLSMRLQRNLHKTTLKVTIVTVLHKPKQT